MYKIDKEVGVHKSLHILFLSCQSPFDVINMDIVQNKAYSFVKSLTL